MATEFVVKNFRHSNDIAGNYPLISPELGRGCITYTSSI